MNKIAYSENDLWTLVRTLNVLRKWYLYQSGIIENAAQSLSYFIEKDPNANQSQIMNLVNSIINGNGKQQPLTRIPQEIMQLTDDVKANSYKIMGKNSDSPNSNQSNDDSNMIQIIKILNARCIKYKEVANSFEGQWKLFETNISNLFGSNVKYTEQFIRYGKHLKNLVVSVFETYTDDIMSIIQQGDSNEEIISNLKQLKRDNLTDMSNVMNQFKQAFDSLANKPPLDYSNENFKHLMECMAEIAKWMGKVYRQLDAGF